MARILLYDPDENHAHELVGELKHRRFYCEVFHHRRDFLARLKRGRNDFDILMLNLAFDTPKEWELLDMCGQLIKGCSSQSRLLCVSRVYRGPRTRLEAELRGARIVYEQ